MADASYCTLPDVVPFLPAGGLPNPARAATASASGDYVECDGHQLADGDTVTFRAYDGGSLPGGLSEGTTYYVTVTSTSRFQVSTSSGGAVVNLTSAGVDFVFVAELPWAKWIDEAARDCDGIVAAYCGSHVVPVIEPYPRVLVLANAELAAARGLKSTGGAAIDYSAALEAVQKRLAPWAKSLPLRGEARSNTYPANLAITASAGAVDPRGWAPNGNEVLP